MAQHLAPLDEQTVFIASNDGPEIDVRIGGETVWLTTEQMAKLFGRDVSVIRRHVRNVFNEGELSNEGNYRQILPVINRGRPEPTFSLDVVISVGYRVKSQRGVEFRQWATRVLRERLVSDYRRRVAEASHVLGGLKNIEHLARNATMSGSDQTLVVLGLIERYARSWQLLLQYDEKKLPPAPAEPSKRMARITDREATNLIHRFKQSLARKGQATDLFGRERADGLSSILANLDQTWGGTPVYPNIESRAAHLIYFVIKNHPFYDGNKRIGSLLFLRYLEKNRHPLLDENTLVALTLLIAESDPRQKEIVIRLTVSLMQDLVGADPSAHGDRNSNDGIVPRGGQGASCLNWCP
jgi:prophage maintenance system killer protein